MFVYQIFIYVCLFFISFRFCFQKMPICFDIKIIYCFFFFFFELGGGRRGRGRGKIYAKQCLAGFSPVEMPKKKIFILVFSVYLFWMLIFPG